MVKPLHFQVNPHSGVPVYRQVMDQVRYYVASGALKAGDQLPSIRELAQMLGVNPTTIVKTYTELEHGSVIEMQHGKGAFVAAKPAKMSEVERHSLLQRLARHLVVEGRQMGASGEEILQAVQEQIEETGTEGMKEEGNGRSKRFAHG
jgi:GntR family transcriptional regulator